MNADTIDRLRRVNPVPQDPPAPPIGPLLALRERELTDRGRGWAGRRSARRTAAAPSSRRRVLALVPIALACALLVFALRGGGGGQFDVAAAVYRAITPGHGVRYVVTEQASEADGKRMVLRVQRWSISDPPSERSVSLERRNYGPERRVRIESAIAPGTTWSSWWSGRPGVIEHTRATGVRMNEVAVIRAAYRAGHLRVLDKVHQDGRAVYRLQVVPPRTGPAARSRQTPNVLIVDARTFVPVEDINYGSGPHGRLVPTFVLRYRTFEELPPTPANLALVKLAAHPGTHVVQRR
ncbi:MAG TPA: hypothetical protein VK680_06065 [Solirubrobacteraceae bacterium]|jgi:hypothetical protein|nr:hypothetical protein [Solirubrobacteraceae bacterium]